MAAPLKSGKQSVNLASTARVSKIRRDPPPVAKKVEVSDPEDRDTQTVVIGVIAFAVAFFIVMLGVSTYAGWSPSDYNVELNLG
jgi:hypothetical protein